MNVTQSVRIDSNSGTIVAYDYENQKRGASGAPGGISQSIPEGERRHLGSARTDAPDEAKGGDSEVLTDAET